MVVSDVKKLTGKLTGNWIGTVRQSLAARAALTVTVMTAAVAVAEAGKKW